MDGPVPQVKAPLPAAVESRAGRTAGNRKRSGSGRSARSFCAGGRCWNYQGAQGAKEPLDEAETGYAGGWGEVPSGSLPAPTLRGNLVAARVRGAAAPGPGGGPHAKPQHTPGRGYGWPGGQEGHPDKGHRFTARLPGGGPGSPRRGRSPPCRRSRGADPPKRRGGIVMCPLLGHTLGAACGCPIPLSCGMVPAARRAAGHRMAAPSDPTVPSPHLYRTAVRRAASNRAASSPRRGDLHFFPLSCSIPGDLSG